MADFCNKCNLELFGRTEKFNIKRNEVLQILCEGCGKVMYIDYTGFQVACQFCINGDEGVCYYAGEISNDFFCKKFKRRKNE